MILENRQTKEIETITIKGNQADLQEGMVALAKGALVAELGLSLHVDRRKPGNHQFKDTDHQPS